MSLTKSSKSRPTADKLLAHPYVIQAGLSSLLCKDLIEKSRNPKPNQLPRCSDDLEDDDEIGPVSVRGIGSGKDDDMKDQNQPESPVPRIQEVSSPGDIQNTKTS